MLFGFFGFHTRVCLSDVYVEGISQITAQDLAYAQKLGYTIKLLGIATAENDEIEVRVHPALLPLNHPLANVNDSFNAVLFAVMRLVKLCFMVQEPDNYPLLVQWLVT